MGADGGAFGGLVPLPTSDTRVELDVNLNRWKKLRSSVRFTASLHERALARQKARFYTAMVTVTYAPEREPEPRDVTALLKCIKQWHGRRGIAYRYVWVGELQERGALHYHLLFWLPKGISMPKPDKQGWWKWGSTRIEAARSSVGYLTKYASKLRSKQKAGVAFPKGFHMHGQGGLEPGDREARAFEMLPGWTHEFGSPELRLRRVGGGGVASRETGEHWPSPWALVGRRFQPGVGWFVKLERVA